MAIKTYTDGWDLAKDTLKFAQKNPDRKDIQELKKVINYNVTTLKKISEQKIKASGGKLTINWGK
jgi:hypothetical protein